MTGRHALRFLAVIVIAPAHGGFAAGLALGARLILGTPVGVIPVRGPQLSS